MTVQQYLEYNLPFYHITPSKNKTSILRDGLRAQRCNAICTVRSDNHDIWDVIIQSQLNFHEVDTYTVIKLTPETHQIKVDEVAPDSVTDLTAPLHSYICKNNIPISEEDIICDNYVSGRGANLPKEEIESLSGYTHDPIPNISILNTCGL